MGPIWPRTPNNDLVLIISEVENEETLKGHSTIFFTSRKAFYEQNPNKSFELVFEILKILVAFSDFFPPRGEGLEFRGIKTIWLSDPASCKLAPKYIVITFNPHKAKNMNNTSLV